MEIRDYLEEYHTKQTADTYLRAIEKFRLRHKNTLLLTYQDIVTYLNSIPKGRVKTLASIKRYYDYLIEIEEIDTHPCKQLTIKRKKRAIQTQDLFSTDELELLLNRESRYQILKYRNKAIFSLLIYQGLAPENLINLRLKDVDFYEGTIYIKQTKSLSRRTLELKAKQVNYLMQYIYKERDTLNVNNYKNLFIGKLGSPITIGSLNILLRPFRSLFPSKTINASTIRQSVIRNQLKQGLSLEEVQELSGLKWLSSIERYKESNLEERQKLMNEFHPMK